jgi:hypothetical protein
MSWDGKTTQSLVMYQHGLLESYPNYDNQQRIYEWSRFWTALM